MKTIKLSLGLLFIGIALKAQIISTVAGNGAPGSYSGDGGQATAASLSWPYKAVCDGNGNMYILDSQNNRIRKVNTNGIISTFAGNGTRGYSGDGGQATAAKLFTDCLAIDGSGNIYTADSNRIRKINAGTGIISTIAGNGNSTYSGDGGPATAAQLSCGGLCFDATGNLYFADGTNNRIRKINTAGIISTVAGNGTAGTSGDGGAATAAELNNVADVAIDVLENLYIAGWYGNTIRKVNTAGIINTVAGNGTNGYSGDGGPATAAELFATTGVAVDGYGNLFISDFGNGCIRMVNSSGIITTITGNTCGFSTSPPCCYFGDGGPATAAGICCPEGLTVYGGNLYIADRSNNRIRMINNVGTLGIEGRMAQNTGITVKPNPVNGNFTINIRNARYDKAKIVLYTSLGQPVYNKEESYNGSSGEYTLDVSQLPNGTYNLQVTINGQNMSEKVVVQH